ncbi:VOC family protein [Saccharopolyspora sp. NPDC002686]|uniref:VOC family protein n=1 Tax=Saccharopolyspora sp. NPDC002686 TaxID=3154541 RepID=UPI003328A0AC
MPARPVVRGLRRVDLISSDPVASAVRCRALLDWTPEPTGRGFDCWVGDRRCTRIRKPRAGEQPGWHPVFAGKVPACALTGPDDAMALVARGRAQHGPWAPPPRPGEPRWIELVASDPERADAFWSETLNLAVHPEPHGANYLIADRPLASRTDRLSSAGWGWLCFFAVDDLDAAEGRVEAVGSKVADRLDHPLLGDALLVTDPNGATFGLVTGETWG